MKWNRYLLVIIALSIACSALQTQNPNPGQQSPNPANPPNASQNATTSAPQADAAKNRTKAQPIAKSQEEFNAYQAVASKPDPSEMETAAADFARKYPDSELLVPIYSSLMQKYQNINNSEKVLEIGRKILQLDPDNIPALGLTSYVLAESTRESDLDRDQKYAEGMKDAQAVVKKIDTALVVPPNVTPEQVAGLKAFLISMANAAMGYIELNQKNYATSEQHLKAAIDATHGGEQDPVTYLRLAVAQDNQKKYADAMTNVDKALQVAEAQKNEPVVNMAKSEKDRLSKLTTGAGTPPKPAAIKQ
jgi:tetratricopeptide (TPR) repeat protein